MFEFLTKVRQHRRYREGGTLAWIMVAAFFIPFLIFHSLGQTYGMGALVFGFLSIIISTVVGALCAYIMGKPDFPQTETNIFHDIGMLFWTFIGLCFLFAWIKTIFA